MIFYVVMRVDETLDVHIGGRVESIPLSYTEGMIGAIPVFKDEESAKKFAGDEFSVCMAKVETEDA